MKFKSLLTLGAMALALGLASCSNEDFGSKQTAPKGNPVEITVQATINHGNDSRAVINEVSGSIKSVWNEGDCIFAYNPKDQSYAGFLVASQPDDNGRAKFSGTLYLYEDCDLYFYYLGTDPIRDYNEFWIDLTEQTYTLEQLGELAVMVDEKVHFTYNPKGVSTIKNTTNPSGDLIFNLMLSYAHFNISLPDGVTYNNEDIVLRGKNLKNGAALLLLSNYLDIPDWEEDETITINGLGDLYFAFIPGNDINLHFSTEIDGIEYYYDYPRAMNFKPSVYYRRDAGEGTFIGVPIPLTPDNKFTVDFAANGYDVAASASVAGATLPEPVYEITHEETAVLTVPADAPTLDGYNFLGYRKSGSTSTTAEYQPGSSITIDINNADSYTSKAGNSYTFTLEAVWELAQPEYTFILAVASGWLPGDEGRKYISDYATVSNKPERMSVTIRANSHTFDIPNNVPTAEGYKFLGYNDNRSLSTSILYRPNGQITLDVSDTLDDSFKVSTDGKTYTKTIQCLWEEVIDHTKNPLLKWAESDLVYDKSSKTSSFASSYKEAGSLYQWGRNAGWSDYKDALGDFNGNGPGHNYATYGKFYCDGTGITSGYDHTAMIAYDAASDLTELLDWYFMNPKGTDYWVSSFGDGGSTWAERAIKCGYSSATPCPSGWRLPTKADFSLISPSSGIIGSATLASLLSNATELKTLSDGTKYAIRWTAETESSKTYLRIDALCVGKAFSSDKLNSINWNDSNVVTRYFGPNGFIHGFYHENIVGTGRNKMYFYVGRPMPGTETHTDTLWQSSNGTYWTILYNYITDYSVNNEGFYWVSDQQIAFKFNDNTRVKSALSSYQSLLGFGAINAQDCCSIRCIKAD